MTQIIPPSELEHLTETELRSKFYDIQKDLARSPLPAEKHYEVAITLENIRQAIIRKTRGPRP